VSAVARALFSAAGGAGGAGAAQDSLARKLRSAVSGSGRGEWGGALPGGSPVEDPVR
jgi:hypothetical protein